MKRQLILEDGSVFVGEGFGSEHVTEGEIVFTTGMTGYQETLTDPSFYGQIVTFTYPLIGNYGINEDDFEATCPYIKGVVVKEWANFPSNWRSSLSLDEFLKKYNIPGISSIDTRKLTRKIREFGTLKAAICDEHSDPSEIVESLKARQFQIDAVAQVSTKVCEEIAGSGKHIVLVDFGAKKNIVAELVKRNCKVTIVPFQTSATEILALKPDGVMLSNGPGNPKDVSCAIPMIQSLLGKIPLFGICLGHQLFALACGADTFKLKFGHRGANHPVQSVETGKTVMTAQNHGYAVNEQTLKGTGLIVTERALNDGTIEGLAHTVYPAFTVQYHPEASPGPHDSNPLFDQFLYLIEEHTKEETNYAKTH
ncbi:carbamoyl phosphate synthase small subunit [Heyndrickxia ginsengihumi]|uniref:Carbamoyl phosphate synthase small chain n=1 Tax=Heyndrickxia ginsengihumi TaxID=363870 RepID=A0A0A6VFF6_9BACI|nr:carbamoyl phosphate synthase small subunit [Heyndrickxia ginsengihumi]KHD86198.1 carbamoyl phosphate synthase small subunit [Heyndrickxia ginsengihumi]MBE6183445.1 glutamine-hydrolyzing carbamoyl-phosphate synthase small subunit [Bacillus sp. (in: firmicutes)]MCM3022428.1 carbamoyl phosphate synthase small subunit [Heyndrickxia ginsengihumi]NEY18631.1 glutamine-hydrolyzing carbamoyl-phosphate synthase small subunit [Heyndrickxia ginsengihumi]